MQDQDIRELTHTQILKIVMIYAVFAGLWILMSDMALHWLIKDTAAIQVAQTLKGWFFVTVTSLLLYFLLNRSSVLGYRNDDPKRYAGLVNWKPWQLYLFAGAVTFLTLVLRLGIPVSFGEHPLLILLLFPIILSAAMGGLGPGLFSTFIATLVAAYYLPPSGNFGTERSYDLLQLGFLTANGLLVSFLSMMLHEARHRSDSERKKATDSLAEKARALQLLDGIATGSTDAIYAKDLQGRYLMINQAAARFVGKTAQEVLGKDDTHIFSPADAAAVMEGDRNVMEANQTSTYEEIVQTTSGLTTFHATKGPIHDIDGRVIGMFGISRDITKLKGAEDALRKERDLNQSYLDTVQNIMLLLDSQGRISMINRYGCELLDYQESDLLGKDWFKTCLPQPEGMEIIFPVFNQIITGDLKNVTHYENAVLCRNGNQRMVSWRNTPFKNNAGDIIGTLSSGEDITDRKSAENRLRDREVYQRAVLNNFPFMVWLKDRDSRILAANEEYARVANVSDPDELVGKTDLDYWDKELADKYRADDRSVLVSGKPKFVEEEITEPGRRFWIETYKSPVEIDGRIIGTVGFARDITERKEAEIEILQRNSELERFNKAAMGRELEMISLKQQINELSRQLGKEPPYPLSFIDSSAELPKHD